MKKIIYILLLTLSFNIFAANNYIIVDAGSSGSRIHFFKYENNKKLPAIEEIFSEKNKLPLASFKENPEKAGESLKPLLDELQFFIKQDQIATPVKISILATAGMRLLTSAEQTKIYNNVEDYLNKNYKDIYLAEDIKTVSGKMEGVYNWLDINYLSGTFENNSTPVGAIDTGGASTEISYSIDKSLKPLDETNLKINGKDYIIFSKSFLGLGLNEAVSSMVQDKDAAFCYPKNYEYSYGVGDFNLIFCEDLFNQIISNYNIKNQILPTYKTPKFIATSGAYYVYRFFGATPDLPDRETLEQNIINPVCKNDWETLKKAYPAEPEEYLANYCNESLFLDDLYLEAFELRPEQLIITSKVNETSLDWALGALLYKVIK